VQVSHRFSVDSAVFDDDNLVSCAGLVPVMSLAQRCGLAMLLAERLKIAARGGANAAVKVLALVAGMVCGADSIADMDLLRHGGMSRLFDGVRAPSTLGTFLVRHEALVRREALGVEGGGRPSRRVVAAARSKRSAA
jgi:hypothetical protein